MTNSRNSKNYPVNEVLSILGSGTGQIWLVHVLRSSGRHGDAPTLPLMIAIHAASHLGIAGSHCNAALRVPNSRQGISAAARVVTISAGPVGHSPCKQ